MPYAPAAGSFIAGAALPAQNWRERAVHGAAIGAAASPQGLSQAALLLSNPALGPLISSLLRGGAAVADITQNQPRTAP